MSLNRVRKHQESIFISDIATVNGARELIPLTSRASMNPKRKYWGSGARSSYMGKKGPLTKTGKTGEKRSAARLHAIKYWTEILGSGDTAHQGFGALSGTKTAF